MLTNLQHQDFDALEKQLSNLTVPYFHMLGNHDLANFDFDEWRNLSSKRYKFHRLLPTKRKRGRRRRRGQKKKGEELKMTLMDNSSSEKDNDDDNDYASDTNNDDDFLRASFSPVTNWRFVMLNSFAESVLGRSNASYEAQRAWRLLRSHNKNINPNSYQGTPQ